MTTVLEGSICTIHFLAWRPFCATSFFNVRMPILERSGAVLLWIFKCEAGGWAPVACILDGPLWGRRSVRVRCLSKAQIPGWLLARLWQTEWCVVGIESSFFLWGVGDSRDSKAVPPLVDSVLSGFCLVIALELLECVMWVVWGEG